MTLPSTTPQDSHAILVAALFLTGLCVVYWRMAIRVIVIITLGLALYGLIATLHV